MIITKLEGGLGNQMFQYAMGKILAVKTQSELKIDHSYFLHLINDPKITQYVYSLTVFPAIKNRPATIFDFKLLSPILVPQIQHSSEIIYNSLRLGRLKIVKEKEGLTFDRSLLDLTGDLYLMGFWQHYQYPALLEQSLRRDFAFSAEIEKRADTILNQIPKAQRVSVHVRRGDYLNIGLGACSLAYYRNAVGRIEKEIKNPYYVVVSNDIAWARQNLKFLKRSLFVDPKQGDEATDLAIISKSSHHIIANSTFSWWGAWLNPNLKKIVIAPQPWFDWENFKGKSPVPPNWILLKK